MKMRYIILSMAYVKLEKTVLKMFIKQFSEVNLWAHSSAWLERLNKIKKSYGEPLKQEVEGSNPFGPIIFLYLCK